MRLWTSERGTLWALETVGNLPPLPPVPPEVEFKEVGDAEATALAAAMNQDSPTLVRQRLHTGRRAFALAAGSEIVSYCWVTCGPEYVGELEREFQLLQDEAYIWDCATVPAWRGKGCYSALLGRIVHRLDSEGVARIWIGASRQNRPSIRGFANAGFQPVVDVAYHRLYRLTFFWIDRPLSNGHSLVSSAYRILLAERERRFGQLAIGWKKGRAAIR